MTIVRSTFVLHWIVPDAKGPLESRKPYGAVAFERAVSQIQADKPTVAVLGHPGKRFRIACRAVERTTREHRATTEAKLVNCPGCRNIMRLIKERAASHAKT